MRNSDENRLIAGRDLDRRRRGAWIFAASALLIVPACAAPSDDDVESASQGVAVSGAWKPPADVSSVGAALSVSYDDAPRWTGTSGCGSGLRPGTRKLGAFLQGKYDDAIASIGGFACRQNTANRSKTSVHGSGRAMDIFVPKVRGGADNGKGDPIANWLVVNAETIGVQLIIWDRTVWFPGRAPKAYTGPHPHDDHIHVEITNEAAAMETDFFTRLGSTTEPNDTTEPDTTEPDTTEPDTTEPVDTTEPIDDEPAPKDEEPTTQPPPSEPPPSDPAPTEPAPPDATSGETGASATDTPGQPAPASTAPSEDELDPDGPGETDSLPDEEKPKKKKRSSAGGYVTASSGCAVAGSPATGGGPTAPLGSVALGAAVLGWVRARRRGR